MLVVAETAPPALSHARVEHRLARVAEGRVAEVVAEPDRLREVLVQPQRARHVARDPARLERVREPGAVVVALGRDEHLGLVLQAPERLRVHDPVAVALERRAMVGVRLGLLADGRVRAGRERRERLLEPLDPLPERGSGELGHARIDCVSSRGERFEARGADVELVEQEAPREVRLTSSVERRVRDLVRKRVARPCAARPRFARADRPRTASAAARTRASPCRWPSGASRRTAAGAAGSPPHPGQQDRRRGD